MQLHLVSPDLQPSSLRQFFLGLATVLICFDQPSCKLRLTITGLAESAVTFTHLLRFALSAT